MTSHWHHDVTQAAAGGDHGGAEADSSCSGEGEGEDGPPATQHAAPGGSAQAEERGQGPGELRQRHQ